MNSKIHKNKHSLWRTFTSVLAAFFGVQASSKAQEDFNQPSPWVFILIGIVLLVLLVLGLASIVSFVLRA